MIQPASCDSISDLAKYIGWDDANEVFSNPPRNRTGKLINGQFAVEFRDGKFLVWQLVVQIQQREEKL